MDIKKIIIGILVILLIVLIYRNYQNNKNNPRNLSGNVINIGLDVEVSGDLAAVGQSSQMAAKLAVDQVNKNGGLEVNGKKYSVQLDVKDNKGDVETTKRVSQDLISDGV